MARRRVLHFESRYAAHMGQIGRPQCDPDRSDVATEDVVPNANITYREMRFEPRPGRKPRAVYRHKGAKRQLCAYCASGEQAPLR